MKNYRVTISLDREIFHFEVGEYMHHNGGCKVKVYKDGRFMVSFEPDQYDYLQVCQNPGELKEELLHLLADQIEAHHPLGIGRDLDKPV